MNNIYKAIYNEISVAGSVLVKKYHFGNRWRLAQNQGEHKKRQGARSGRLAERKILYFRKEWRKSAPLLRHEVQMALSARFHRSLVPLRVGNDIRCAVHFLPCGTFITKQPPSKPRRFLFCKIVLCRTILRGSRDRKEHSRSSTIAGASIWALPKQTSSSMPSN